MNEQKNKTETSTQENINQQEEKATETFLSKVIKKHGEKFNFFASISTIVGSLIAIFTLIVTVCTLNTATSINNTINSTINDNQIIQSGDANIVQYGDNSSITISMDNIPQYEAPDYMFKTEEEMRLLSLAKQYFDAGDYQMAFSIYSSEELQENDYATINQAYCYAHGYGVIEDTEIAMSLYDSVGSDDARRNKLALMIRTNSAGFYDSAILDELSYFSSKQDYNVLNYLSLCKYGEPVDSISDKSFDIDLSELYQWRLVEDKLYITSQTAYSTSYEKLVFVGTVTGSSPNGMRGIYYRYQLYRRHQNLSWLERVFG
ncbi:MAG: sel1 repeat family protein [Oscillospiraceae bacterium]|nr:sel1 repeat family protein [Oscillospiraceae bacterium]